MIRITPRSSRSITSRLAGLVFLLAALVGCTSAPPAAPAASTGVPPSSSSPAASPAGSPGAAPSVASAPSGQAFDQAAWDATVASARKEGTVVISGPPGDLWRKALTSFEEAYPGIQVQYTGADSRNFWPKLDEERGGGLYNWDLRVGGPDPQVFAARDNGTLDPVKPLLVLPEVTNESKWFGGFNGLYADTGKTYLPAFIAQTDYTTFVNRDVVTESDLSSDQQLLDPRWKGKMSIQDPRGGAGLGTLTTMLVKYGAQYVRDLQTNLDVVVSGDNRQMTEWVIRNTYPIAIGLSDQDLTQFRTQGLNPNVRGLGQPTKLSLGFGGIQLINRGPHPQAAKVFINWLLSQKGQQQIVTLTQSNSRRLDVPVADPTKAVDPARMSEYVAHQYEDLLPARTKAQQLAEELLK